MNLSKYFSRQPARTIFISCVVLVFIVGVVDYVTGSEFGLSVFYLVPICTAAWFAGRNAAILTSVCSAVAWLVAELMSQQDYSHAIVPFWNATVRLGLFFVSGALTAEVAVRKRVEAALRHQTNILESILNSMGDGVLVADLEGKILLSNPAAERLLRNSFKNANLKNWLKDQETSLGGPLFPGAVPNENPLARAAAGETIDGAELVLRDARSGSETWLSATGRPLLNDRGDAKGAVIVFSDLTSRKSLEKQIAEISEREQRRIGQDLHDGLCQHLVSTAFAATVLERKLSDQKNQEAASAEQIADMINEAISQARGLARGLHPARLDEDGLAAALEQLAEMTQTLTGISCELHTEGPVVIHDRIAAANLYRIAQEAVNNAVKHAKPSRISIELEAVEEEITLAVRDDGPGFSLPTKNGHGMGLHIMNSRARLIGASLDIRRGTTGGTTVSCSFLNTNPVQVSHV